MQRRTAILLFLIACLLIAALLLVRAISPLAGGIAFALALVIFGGLSRGFRG